MTYVKAELADAEGCHDWWHICRVWHTLLIHALKDVAIIEHIAITPIHPFSSHAIYGVE